MTVALEARVGQEQATLSLLVTDWRVTCALFAAELWRREVVGGKVLAAKYGLVVEYRHGMSVTEPSR